MQKWRRSFPNGCVCVIITAILRKLKRGSSATFSPFTEWDGLVVNLRRWGGGPQDGTADVFPDDRYLEDSEGVREGERGVSEPGG